MFLFEMVIVLYVVCILILINILLSSDQFHEPDLVLRVHNYCIVNQNECNFISCVVFLILVVPYRC